MTVRRRGNKLERWEIALIKAMIADDRWPNDQDILAYFTRPTRSINHRAIAEIRTGKKHTAVTASAADDLEGFLASWPEIDAETGLSLRGDELLIKAREAMIAAVHTFNSGGLTFRAELFIVTAIIAWTYLLHAWFKREGIDYRHTKNQNGQKVVIKTPSGAEKFWELGQCLKHARCPIEQGTKDNLAFLLELRHEIEPPLDQSHTGEGLSHREPRQSCKRRPGYNRNLIGGGEDRRERQRPAGEKCFEVVTDGEGPMAGAQPAQAMTWLRLARWRKAQPSAVSHLSHRRGKGTGAPALRPSPTGTAMDEVTARQKRTVAALIARTAAPITFDEARRVIRGLKREQAAFPILIEKIIEAERAGDHERLGRLLVDVKHRVSFGAWLPMLRDLGIHPRRAQRLMARRLRESGDLVSTAQG